MTSAIDATIRYARTDHNAALLHEKAYILNYETPPSIPKSNFTIDFFPGIRIHDLRTAELTFRDNGLAIASLDSCMPQADFDDEHKIEKLYLPQVHRCVRETLAVDEVYIFDYMIRKREASFPFQAKTKDNAAQPALSAHIGRLIFLRCVWRELMSRCRLHHRRNPRAFAEILQRKSRRVRQTLVPDRQVRLSNPLFH